MRIPHIEAWTLTLVDQVTRGSRVEDSRVELKSQWPDDPAKAARRLAGHANAARGDDILWIIGLDQQRGVVGASPAETGEWLHAIARYFDGLAPAVQDVVVATGSGVVVALLFDTSRAPFVVKVPGFGTVAGVTASLEVPWREATEVRSARREDLIRVLAPTTSRPTVEVLGARAKRLVGEVGVPYNAFARLSLYIVPTSSERVVYPLHRARMSLEADGDANIVSCVGIHLEVPPPASNESRFGSRTLLGTHTEAIIDGPGTFSVVGNCDFPFRPGIQFFDIRATLGGVPDHSTIGLQARVSKPAEVLDVSEWVYELAE